MEKPVLSNVVVECLTLLLRVLDVSASILDPETGLYSLNFYGFPQFLQVNADIVP
jgi:hypothetical protein